MYLRTHVSYFIFFNIFCIRRDYTTFLLITFSILHSLRWLYSIMFTMLQLRYVSQLHSLRKIVKVNSRNYCKKGKVNIAKMFWWSSIRSIIAEQSLQQNCGAIFASKIAEQSPQQNCGAAVCKNITGPLRDHSSKCVRISRHSQLIRSRTTLIDFAISALGL